MNLIQGSIIAIEPPDYTNQFGVQYQNIVIRTVQGDVKGRIGTKKPYTEQNINHQGQWECETAQGGQGPYNKFKKHYNKPYNAQQAPQQAPQGTNYQQPTPQGKKEPDWDAIAEGKVRHGVVCAFIAAPIDAMPSIQDIEYWVKYIMTGRDPNVSAPNTYQKNPDYVGDNPRPPTDDDIPF